jgi:hypothetical protein
MQGAIQVKGRGLGRASEWRGFCHQDGSEKGLGGTGFLSLQESGSKATRDESRRVVECEPATTAIGQRQGRQLELKMGPSGTVSATRRARSRRPSLGPGLGDRWHRWPRFTKALSLLASRFRRAFLLLKSFARKTPPDNASRESVHARAPKRCEPVLNMYQRV